MNTLNIRANLGRAFRLLISFSAIVACLLPAATANAETWPGVDETVVEHIAGEHGREASDPLINTDQGDILLFVFLLAGVVGGFVAGYCWRILTSEKATAGEEAQPRTAG